MCRRKGRNLAYSLLFFLLLLSDVLPVSPVEAQIASGQIAPWIEEILAGDSLSFSERPAARAIAERGRDRVVDALVTMLQHPQVSIRRSSARVLRNLKQYHDETLSDNAIHALLKCLDDPEFSVRRSAAFALGTFDERVVPLLMKELEKDGTRRFWSIWALGEIGPAAKPAVPKLLDLYRNAATGYFETRSGRQNERDIRRYSLVALCKIWAGAEEVPPFLVDLFQPQPKLAADGLAQVGAAAVPFLSGRVENGSAHQKMAAVQALFRIPNTDVHLHAALTNSSPAVRLETAMELGRRRQAAHSSVTHLLARLQDDDPDVRHAAIQAIARIGAGQYDAILRKVLPFVDDSRMQPSVVEILHRAAREDAENAKLVRPLLVAYTRGDANVREVLLQGFFDRAIENSNCLLKTLSDLADGGTPVGEAATEILNRIQARQRAQIVFAENLSPAELGAIVIDESEHEILREQALSKLLSVVASVQALSVWQLAEASERPEGREHEQWAKEIAKLSPQMEELIPAAEACFVDSSSDAYARQAAYVLLHRCAHAGIGLDAPLQDKVGSDAPYDLFAADRLVHIGKYTKAFPKVLLALNENDEIRVNHAARIVSDVIIKSKKRWPPDKDPLPSLEDAVPSLAQQIQRLSPQQDSKSETLHQLVDSIGRIGKEISSGRYRSLHPLTTGPNKTLVGTLSRVVRDEAIPRSARRQAAYWLGEMGAKEALIQLVTLDNEAAKHALRPLSRSAQGLRSTISPAITRLIEIAGDETLGVTERVQAINILSWSADDGVAAIPLLQKLSKKEAGAELTKGEEQLRESARRAHLMIQRNRKKPARGGQP